MIVAGLCQTHLTRSLTSDGVSHDEAAALIAQALPAVVNHVTPDGALPDAATADQHLCAIGAAAG